MTNKLRFTVLAIIYCICASVCADQLAIGSWRTHLAYSNTLIIAQTPEKVYGISNGALYYVDKDDHGIELLSKITGLNDNNIVNIAYSDQQETLVVAYANANIDLITPNGIYNITDLYRKNMAGSKKINHIYCRDNYAYLSCDFGIVVLNIAKQEITDTYIIGSGGENVAVAALFEHDGQFYATTQSAIMKAPVSGANLANFENWTTITTPSTGTNINLAMFNDNLYVLQNDSAVYKQQSNGTWSQLYSGIGNIGTDGDNLYLMELNRFSVVDATGKRTYNNSGIAMVQYDAVNDCFWTAANTAGIAKIGRNDNSTNIFCPNGPAVNYAWRIRYSDEGIYVVPGGYAAVFKYRPGYVMQFREQQWKNISAGDIQQAFGVIPLDISDVAIDPDNSAHVYAASFGFGLFEFLDGKPIKQYIPENSGIESYVLNKLYPYIWVDALQFDQQGNLWIGNLSASKNNIKVLLKGSKKMVNIKNAATASIERMPHLLISSVNPNQKWVLSMRSPAGIGVFDDNGTIENQTDDQAMFVSKFTDQDGNAITNDNLYAIAQDHKGSIWVGGTNGIFTITNPNNVFKNNAITTSRIKIPRNDGTNLADYLLDGIQINAIAVDGSNRKWIGTESNGVFLVSEDGLETIEHFTSDNSPLLSDNIISIGINEKTGEVFFGTGNGLCSYQSDASEGNDTFTNVHAFPNPVREDYSGVITITGLVTDTRVKITDIAGNVVYETISNGGIATWDGNRRGGGRVATGVYLAMCFSPDGTQHETTKILIINK
ncbi:MAG: hypothetical protein ACI392_07470 [Paludibacteraceae bacterium]